MKATFFLAAIPLALAAPQPQGDGNPVAGDYESLGFNGAAASYLVAQLESPAGASILLSANNDPRVQFPTDAAGSIEPTGLLAAYGQAATAVPSDGRALYSSILAEAGALQAGGAAVATSAASVASSVASSAGSMITSAASMASASGSHAASSAASVASSAASAAANSASTAAAGKTSSAAAAHQTMAVGMMAGALAGIAGIAAAL